MQRPGEPSVFGDDAASQGSGLTSWQPGGTADPGEVQRRERARSLLRERFGRHTDEKSADGGLEDLPDERLRLNLAQFKALVRDLLRAGDKGGAPAGSEEEWAASAFRLAPKERPNHLRWREFWAMLPKRSSMFSAVAVGDDGQQVFFEAFFRGAARRLTLKRQRAEMMPQFRELLTRYAAASGAGGAAALSASTGGPAVAFVDFFTLVTRDCPPWTEREVSRIEQERHVLSLWLQARAMWSDLCEDLGQGGDAGDEGQEGAGAGAGGVGGPGVLGNDETPAFELPDAGARRWDLLSWPAFEHFALYSEAFYSDPPANAALRRNLDVLVPPGKLSALRRERCCNALAGGAGGAGATADCCVQ